MKIQKCSYCSGYILDGEFCNFCTDSYTDLPCPSMMSGEAREKELRLLVCNPIHIPISMVSERIDVLVGREVKYGEITFNWQGLLREAYNNGNV